MKTITSSQTIRQVNVTANQDVRQITVTASQVINSKTITVAQLGQRGLQGEQGIQGGLITKTSGENLNSHTPIALINNLAYKLDASNPLHQFAFVGFTEASSLIGQSCTIKQIGEVTLLGWDLIPNQHYLAGTNGTLIIENLSGSNFTKIIAYATDSNTLQIIKDSLTINKN
jgi:hypothetical protein